MRRLAMILVAASIVAACQPPQQLEIDFTIRRNGTITVDGGGDRYLTLSGVVACSGGTPDNREPLDLFVTLEQGTVIDTGIELHERCSEPKVWTQTAPLESAIQPGQVSVTITACTNPGFPIDEDCAEDSEIVTVTSA
ncbi:hypothetical protein HC251_15825 [Iamia sp. SCSIO 61187]|uniref:hypothetical protein n=1 Tax=Iamia sp. SCSIO 61187 TaxID=2722752 RepID=UPI001C62E934|nr:hypothetical protein [Iamia sp. SCSIO 61187]QYG93748.1 hypothetical protein HC251_15825 [Iamia sp. SCSIO 61187]